MYKTRHGPVADRGVQNDMFNVLTLSALGSSYFPEDSVQVEFRSNSELIVYVFK